MLFGDHIFWYSSDVIALMSKEHQNLSLNVNYVISVSSCLFLIQNDNSNNKIMDYIMLMNVNQNTHAFHVYGLNICKLILYLKHGLFLFH